MPEQLSADEHSTLVRILKQRYISPYKIVYMIDQKEADYFKQRNQFSGCCSSSSITIPKHQMTKTELFLSEAIHNLANSDKELNQVLESLSDKHLNIVKSGQKENLKVDDNIDKFLVEKVMSEGLNLYLYHTVLQKLKRDSQEMSSSAMLWATPNTWYARFPNTQLDFLSPKTLSDLSDQSKAFAAEGQFLKDYEQNLFRQLKLLQIDGRFEELLHSKNSKRNDTKLINFPEEFAFDGTEESFRQGQIAYPYLKKSLLLLRSVPFELNQKMKQYCTISENNQISFFGEEVQLEIEPQQQRLSKFSTFCPIGGSCRVEIKARHDSIDNLEAVELPSGSLLISDSAKWHLRIKSDKKGLFLLRSWICTLESQKNKESH